MGKRSRKRQHTGGPSGAARRSPRAASGDAPASGHARPVSRRARMDEAPPAPWAPFPLVELCILIGMILLVLAFAIGSDDSRLPMLVGGFVLIATSSVELAVREHFAGFRSHTVLLSGSTVLFPVMPLAVLGLIPRQVLLAGGALAFTLAFFGLRTAFARRAGGMAFRA